MDKRFTAKLQKSPAKGGWTYVVMPGSAKFFGTKGLVKIRGSIDGHPFRASFMAMGDGLHMLPIKADTRKKLGKEAGDSVTIRLEERISFRVAQPARGGPPVRRAKSAKDAFMAVARRPSQL